MKRNKSLRRSDEFSSLIVLNQRKFSHIKPTIIKYKEKYYRIKELG